MAIQFCINLRDRNKETETRDVSDGGLNITGGPTGSPRSSEGPLAPTSIPYLRAIRIFNEAPRTACGSKLHNFSRLTYRGFDWPDDEMDFLTYGAATRVGEICSALMVTYGAYKERERDREREGRRREMGKREREGAVPSPRLDLSRIFLPGAPSARGGD